MRRRGWKTVDESRGKPIILAKYDEKPTPLSRFNKALFAQKLIGMLYRHGAHAPIGCHRSFRWKPIAKTVSSFQDIPFYLFIELYIRGDMGFMIVFLVHLAILILTNLIIFICQSPI